MRVYRDTDPHEIVDYNVSVALSGDFADIHLDRRQRQLPDHRRHEEHGERVRQGARRRRPPARVVRAGPGPALRRRRRRRCTGPGSSSRCTRGTGCSATARRTRTRSPATAGTSARRPSPTTAPSLGRLRRARTSSLLKTTDSEFYGFLQDRYTTLPPTHDRVMATLGDRAVVAHRPRRRLGHVLRRRARHHERASSPGTTASPCSRRCSRWARR